MKIKNINALDSLTIYPESIKIVSPSDTVLRFEYNSSQNNITFSSKSQLPDSVLITYQIFDFNLSSNRFRRDVNKYKNSVYYDNPFEKKAKQRAEVRDEFFSTKGLSKTGSITRGISFGNTQNVYVDAGLNLQLEGKISEDITVVAAISDQNVPYQPEGNTQTLQQFDKVFVQLSTKKSKLTVGDIVLKNPLWSNGTNRSSQFLRYYKNVQGGQVETFYNTTKNNHAYTSISGAVAKGKFASIFVDAIEGVQGPYRLKGPNNERYIVVLANSEKIFIDGRQMERGFNLDYVIDYNSSEITFNPKIIITKYTRIRVDFEYSERNYSRTIFSATHQQSAGKFHFFANYYSEKDNPKNPLSLSLSSSDINLLTQIGNNIDQAVVSGAVELTAFDSKQVLYKKVDTLINNVTYSIFVYSTDANNAVYQLSFTDLGQGNGNYIIKNSVTNGRVYEWTAPLNGVKQGIYEPVKQLPTPTKRQMVTLGTEYQLNKFESLTFETAYSDRDVNLFSAIGNNQNTGSATKIGYKNRGKELSFLSGYQWMSELNYEFDQKYFSAVDRFRDIDFDRDWSLKLDTLSPNSERILNASFGIIGKNKKEHKGITEKKDSLSKTNEIFKFETKDSTSVIPKDKPIARNPQIADKLIYNLSRRLRSDAVDGWQQRLEFAKSLGNITITGNAYLLNSTQKLQYSDWKRVNTEITYNLPIVVPGYVFSLDKNQLRSVSAKDSVIGTAMNYTSHTFYLKSNSQLSTKFRFDYTWREDNLPSEGRILRSNLSKTLNGNITTKLAKSQDINFLVTYRNLEYVNQTISQPNEETVMGRIDWNGSFWKKNIRSELTYNLATGRELKKEYVFLPVPTGQGTHAWRDDNKDGIQQLNEFYEAVNPDERNYVKYYSPTDQYIRAYTQNFNYRLNFSTPLEWRKAEGMKKFLSKLSSVFSWTILRKMTDENVSKRFVPFSKVADSLLLSDQSTLRSVFFFNRTNPKFGMDLNILSTERKQLLTNGFESGRNQEFKLNNRWNVQKNFNLKTTFGKINHSNSSDYLANRNYRVQAYQFTPELTWQPSGDFRLSGSYLFSAKKNVLSAENQESATFNQIALEIKMNKVSKRTISGTIKYIQINYKNGIVDSPVGYEMLEALKPGMNWSVNINWLQKLANGLQLTMIYEGRKSENQAFIQIGKMQVSALF